MGVEGFDDVVFRNEEDRPAMPANEVSLLIDLCPFSPLDKSGIDLALRFLFSNQPAKYFRGLAGRALRNWHAHDAGFYSKSISLLSAKSSVFSPTSDGFD